MPNQFTIIPNEYKFRVTVRQLLTKCSGRHETAYTIQFDEGTQIAVDVTQNFVRISQIIQVFSTAHRWQTDELAERQNSTRVEVPEIISAEQRCFIVLTFFSADSEDMKKISADQLCFSADQL